MIVTDNFVYLHTSRTAGTFLNKLILEHVPGARMLQYHGHLKDLPEEFAHLPVIGGGPAGWTAAARRLAQKNGQHARLFDPVSMV